MDALFDFVLRCPPQPKPEGNIVVYCAPGQKRVLLKQETHAGVDARDGLPSNQNTSTVDGDLTVRWEQVALVSIDRVGKRLDVATRHDLRRRHVDDAAAWRTEDPLVGFDQRSNELSTDVSLGFENIRTRIETHELIR